MGFGKFLLCTVGGIVAAPIVLPAVGLATVAAGPVAAMGAASTVALASTGTLAATGAAAGAAVGAASSAKERTNRKIEEAEARGRREGYEKASNEYEKKFEEQRLAYEQEIEYLRQDSSRKNDLLNTYEKYIEELECQIYSNDFSYDYKAYLREKLDEAKEEKRQIA